MWKYYPMVKFLKKALYKVFYPRIHIWIWWKYIMIQDYLVHQSQDFFPDCLLKFIIWKVTSCRWIWYVTGSSVSSEEEGFDNLCWSRLLCAGFHFGFVEVSNSQFVIRLKWPMSWFQLSPSGFDWPLSGVQSIFLRGCCESTEGLAEARETFCSQSLQRRFGSDFMLSGNHT